MSSPDPYKIAQQVLEPGEKLLWAGRPDYWQYALAGFDKRAGLACVLITLVIVGLVAIVVVLDPEFFHTGSEANLASPTFASIKKGALGLAGAVAGALLLSQVSKLGNRAMEVSHFIYGVTDRRVIQVRCGGMWGYKPVETTSIPVLGLLTHHCNKRFGHVVLNEPDKPEFRLDMKNPEGLYSIRDAESVRAIIARQPYAAHLFSDGEGQA